VTGPISASTTCTKRASTSPSSVINRLRILLNIWYKIWIRDVFTEVHTAHTAGIAQSV
jgi:hypothetical protein